MTHDYTPDWGYRKALPVETLPPMGERFTRALRVVSRFEGGDANNPADPGRRTRWGITERTYRAWLRSKGMDMRGIEEMGARTAALIYRDRYWIPGLCARLPAAPALAQFDAMVQHGPGGSGDRGAVGAVHLLQRALGVADDGVVGPVTRAAVRGASAGLVEHLLFERLLHYWRILDNRPTLREFSGGWRSRVEHLRAEALKHLPRRVEVPRVRPELLRPVVRPLPVPRSARRRLEAA